MAEEGRDQRLFAPAEQDERGLTIGAVCKLLSSEFPDLSISKIRYLEEQQLLAPRRTPGGYRLYYPADIERLRTILRMQRDEFLPLRVIRRELAAGRLERTVPKVGGGPPPARGALSLANGAGAQAELAEVAAELGVEEQLIDQLAEFGLIAAPRRGGQRYLDQTEREVVRAAAELARFGLMPRNLTLLRSAAQREAQLLYQLFAPTLRSRSAERRREGVEAVEEAAAVVVRLKHLLLVKALRELIDGSGG